MTKLNCKVCKDRVQSHSLSNEQMAVFCRECRYLKKLESPGMKILPVYDLESLADSEEKRLPLLGRNGLISL